MSAADKQLLSYTGCYTTESCMRVAMQARLLQADVILLCQIISINCDHSGSMELLTPTQLHVNTAEPMPLDNCLRARESVRTPCRCVSAPSYKADVRLCVRKAIPEICGYSRPITLCLPKCLLQTRITIILFSRRARGTKALALFLPTCHPL